MRSTRHVILFGISSFFGCVVLISLFFAQPAIQTSYGVSDLTTMPLAHGFYRPQTDDADNTYVWTEASASARFMYLGTKPVRLHFELRSAAVAGGPDAPIRVLIGGVEVAQLRPDPNLRDFQSYSLRVLPARDNTLDVTFLTDSFQAPPPDRRVLGTMVRTVGIDRGEGWSSLARRFWLYGALPVCGVLIAFLLLIARRASPPRRTTTSWSTIAGCTAVAISFVGTLGMFLAVGLLVRIGAIDHYRYALWLEGTLYLAGLLAVVTVHLPLGGAAAPTFLEMVSRTPIVTRQMRHLRHVRDALVLAVPAVIAWPLLGMWGTSDVRDKLDWMHNIASFGLVTGFRVSDNDYPPGTYLILAGVSRVAHWFLLDDLLAYKLSLLMFLALTGIVFSLWTQNSAMAAALQLALLVNSIVLGYNDVYFIPTFLLALWALHARKTMCFGLLLVATCLIKWQPILVAPVLLLTACTALLPGRQWRRNAIQIAFTALVPVLFVVGTRIIFGDAFDHALTRGTGDSYLSANALNAYWIVTLLLRWWRPAALMLTDNPYKRYVSIHAPLLIVCVRVLFFIIYSYVVIRWWRTRREFTSTLYFAYLAYLTYCMVSLSVHENHLVPAVALAAVLWARDRRYAPLFFLTALSLNLNLLLFYGLNGESQAPDVTTTLVLSVINLALFLVLLVIDPFRAEAIAKSATSHRRFAPIASILASRIPR